jgi:hypothetical protein
VPRLTAIMLNAAPAQQHGGVWHTLNHEHDINGLESLHAARLAALAKVETEYCAFIDRDDTLPDNTEEQLPRLLTAMERADSDLAYTDSIELVLGTKNVIRPGEYCWAKHVTRVTWMHQLVVIRTEAAKKVAAALPQGLYWTEFLLYAPLAKKNPLYFPEVAYIYDKKVTGMHAHKDIAAAQTNSVQWHLRNQR